MTSLLRQKSPFNEEPVSILTENKYFGRKQGFKYLKWVNFEPDLYQGFKIFKGKKKRPTRQYLWDN